MNRDKNLVSKVLYCDRESVGPKELKWLFTGYHMVRKKNLNEPGILFLNPSYEKKKSYVILLILIMGECHIQVYNILDNVLS